MSAQADDYMYIDNKKFTLLGVEAEKQIIDCVNFVIPIPKGFKVTTSFSCWRGYTADYYVEQNILYGIKKFMVFNTKPDFELNDACSEKLMLPYTGGCIIAYSDNPRQRTDFLRDYLDFDEAYELYFEKGVLKEKCSLQSALEKYRSLDKKEAALEKIREIACEPLKLKHSSYKLKYIDKDFLELLNEPNIDSGIINN